MAAVLHFHLDMVWAILVVGGVSLICGLILLITRWRSLAPVPAEASAAPTASGDTPATTPATMAATTPATTGTAPAMISPPAPTTLLARVFRWSLVVTAALGVIQAVVGGILYLSGARPGDQLHFVYGAIVLLAIPVAWVYSDQKRVRRDFLIMVIALVAVIGAAVRAYMTGFGLH